MEIPVQIDQSKHLYAKGAQAGVPVLPARYFS